MPQPSRGHRVHPTAIVSPEAVLEAGVSIGPYAVVGPGTHLEEGVQVFSHACIGGEPQHKSFDGGSTGTVIGSRTVLREFVTISRSTAPGRPTRVGSDGYIMAYVHIGHDSVVGNGVTIANATQIAGHCEIGDRAYLGGVTTVHQFVRVGTLAATGASTRLQQDVPPYTLADGNPARLYGLNKVGLRRNGLSEETITRLHRAFRNVFVRGPFREAIERILHEGDDEHVKVLGAFLKQSGRGVTRARGARRSL